MQTGFEHASTEWLRKQRDMLVGHVWETGIAAAKGELPESSYERPIAPLRVMFVEQMDAELLRRGENVPAPPWD